MGLRLVPAYIRYVPHKWLTIFISVADPSVGSPRGAPYRWHGLLCGQAAIFFRDPLKQFPSNMIRHVPRPSFADIESDYAYRIVKLACYEIVNHGVEVGSFFGGLAVRATGVPEVISTMLQPGG